MPAISVDTSKILLQRLRAGELDMMIGRVFDSDSANELHFEPVTDEPHALIARSGHPLAARTGLTLEDLARAAWIMPPSGSVLRDRLTSMFLSAGLDQPSETVETANLPVITSLPARSDMVVPLPQQLVQPYLDFGQLTVLPFDLGVRMDVYGVITRRNHRLAPGAPAMLDTLREVVARQRAAQAMPE